MYLVKLGTFQSVYQYVLKTQPALLVLNAINNRRNPIMETYGIEKYGISGTTEIVYNPSYETLYEEETKQIGRAHV